MITDDPFAAWQADRYDTELRRLGNVPARYANAVSDNPHVLAWVESALLGGDRWLLLRGPTGTGKSFQAYAAARTILAAGGVDTGGGTEAEILASLRPPRDDAEARLEQLAGADVLLIDDLGAAKVTEWTEEILYRLLNRRYEAMLPCLLTSNLPTDQLREHVGDRIASRVAEAADVVVLNGPDRRRA